ncbi:MAG: hypothetical protein Q7U54_07550 [Bacteroidales bacterium]|nr:hypothetical protein [Bacteroidales bacterium]
MKTTEILHQAEKSDAAATRKNSKSSKGLKYLLYFFMISWISFLPACAVAIRTPEPSITVESHRHRVFHRNHYRRSHIEYRENDHHNR